MTQFFNNQQQQQFNPMSLVSGVGNLANTAVNGVSDVTGAALAGATKLTTGASKLGNAALRTGTEAFNVGTGALSSLGSIFSAPGQLIGLGMQALKNKVAGGVGVAENGGELNKKLPIMNYLNYAR